MCVAVEKAVTSVTLLIIKDLNRNTNRYNVAFVSVCPQTIPHSARQTLHLYDRSGKSVTSATLFIVNDLAGNTNGNRSVTCYRISANPSLPTSLSTIALATVDALCTSLDDCWGKPATSHPRTPNAVPPNAFGAVSGGIEFRSRLDSVAPWLI